MRVVYARATDWIGRILSCFLALAAIIWGASVLPVIWRQAPVNAAAKHIIAGDNFKREAFYDIASMANDFSSSKWQHPSSLASPAIVSIRQLERAVSDDDRSAVDRQQERLGSAIRRALSSEPADPYLWLVLFWVENAQDGFRVDHLKYLEMSYAQGPNEGWIAVRRNRLALAVFSALSVDLQNKAILEFARLVDSGFVAEAADILTSSGWPVRDRLLPSLSNVDDVYREAFAKTIYRMGYDVSVPGVKPFGYRPWR